MTIHKEGFKIIGISLILGAITLLALSSYLPSTFPFGLIIIAILWILILQFFRHPQREIEHKDNLVVYAPADGKVVAIEETVENEYFEDRRIQVSIFMSPLNVHVNRYPIGGKIKYARYHPGKYLMAWNPKSSIENERSTIVIKDENNEILLRQIAGALARRIITYAQQGHKVIQGTELGFIRFGSRVDLFLPLNSEIKVKIGDYVQSNKNIIAQLHL